MYINLFVSCIQFINGSYRGIDMDINYEMIGKRRGALSRGGIVDYEKVSNIIVRDLKNGYFGNITLDRLDDNE